MTFCSKSLKKYIRISLAGFMSVWLSGVVFLFCCEKINANTSEVEACPLAKMASEDCPMSTRNASDAKTFEIAQGDCADCCGFLPAVFDKTRKIERNQEPIATASNVVVAKFDPSVGFDYTPKATAVYSRVAYQTDLSVLYRVFRI